MPRRLADDCHGFTGTCCLLVRAQTLATVYQTTYHHILLFSSVRSSVTSSGIWRQGVTVLVAPDVSKGRNVCETSGIFYRPTVTSQKTWILSYRAVRSSNLATSPSYFLSTIKLQWTGHKILPQFTWDMNNLLTPWSQKFITFSYYSTQNTVCTLKTEVNNLQTNNPASYKNQKSTSPYNGQNVVV
jgi:hypothetical protein